MARRKIPKEALVDLERSGLTATDAHKMHVQHLPPEQARQWFRSTRHGAYLLPYHQIDGKPTSFYRVRNLAPNPKVRYMQPAGVPPHLYIPPSTLGVPWREIALNTSVALLQTEGEKKSAAACKLELPTIGTGGVYSFQARKWGIELLHDYEIFDLFGRKIFLVPDSDFESNEQVKQATYRNAKRLTDRQAMVVVIRLPYQGEAKIGLDDFLLGHSVSELMQLPQIPLTATELLKFQNFAETDAGNGEVLAHLHGDDIRYDHQRGRWLIWDGHSWRECPVADIERLAVQAARERGKVAATLMDADQKKRAFTFAVSSENNQRIQSAIKAAARVDPVYDTGANWDNDPWLLGVANGVVDLRTGKLRSGGRGDRITLRTDVVFDPKAKCPRFNKFRREVFVTENGKTDHDLIDFVHRSMGYTTTGDISEDALFVCHGYGANAKTTLLNAVRYPLGPHAIAAPMSTLESSHNSEELANLVGRRMVVISEVDEGKKLSESRVKALTGRENISARRLYQNRFEFAPVHKIWLGVNHKPRVSDDSYGFWRRIKLIPFNATFGSDKRDKQLPEVLRAEASGILNWLIEGCLQWQQRGLAVPKSVSTATREYRAEEDKLGEFISQCCDLDSAAKTQRSELWRAYEKWAPFKDPYPLGSRTFYERISSKFKTKTIRGVRYYIGVAVKSAKWEAKK